ncbi:MAG: DUF2764 family protein [Cyclobacteriaceae bacterium]|nr:DUF2764 family protein [Cyclobacteriaceae bacterium]
MSRYFYLVASLPDLDPDKPARKIDFEELYDHILRNLEPPDRMQLTFLMQGNDIENFIKTLAEKRGEPSYYLGFSAPSTVSQELLDHYQRNQDALPACIRELIEEHADWLDDRSLAEVENWLWNEWYEEAIKSKDVFISKFFSFDRDLRNLLLAYNGRQFGIPAKQYMIGDAPINRMLQRSQATDFGLSNEYPFIESMQQAFSDEDPVKLEKTIDKIKWQYIDALNAFSFFDTDIVLGYFLKLQMVKRWTVSGESESPEQRLRTLSEKVMEDFKLPEIFN